MNCSMRLQKLMAELWNALATETIAAIRKLASNKNIVIGGTLWNSVHTVSHIKVLLDENIVYNFHFYEPFLFTHQGAAWTNKQMDFGLEGQHYFTCLDQIVRSL